MVRSPSRSAGRFARSCSSRYGPLRNAASQAPLPEFGWMNTEQDENTFRSGTSRVAPKRWRALASTRAHGSAVRMSPNGLPGGGGWRRDHANHDAPLISPSSTTATTPTTSTRRRAPAGGAGVPVGELGDATGDDPAGGGTAVAAAGGGSASRAGSAPAGAGASGAASCGVDPSGTSWRSRSATSVALGR